ncbi:hypothetical protein E2C01_028510 [Portunus trituberculatus]|uniref:Uncharacterized protein n=1 Tax=Portunus trituberculatus TaxID=210409 RepID=A0A5B7ENT6_PORTR|nr:hypothetical protein [Portunus trituberculatus]
MEKREKEQEHLPLPHRSQSGGETRGLPLPPASSSSQRTTENIALAKDKKAIRCHLMHLELWRDKKRGTCASGDSRQRLHDKWPPGGECHQARGCVVTEYLAARR